MAAATISSRDRDGRGPRLGVSRRFQRSWTLAGNDDEGGPDVGGLMVRA
jgi:hypothetical protein